MYKLKTPEKSFILVILQVVIYRVDTTLVHFSALWSILALQFRPLGQNFQIRPYGPDSNILYENARKWGKKGPQTLEIAVWQHNVVDIGAQ